MRGTAVATPRLQPAVRLRPLGMVRAVRQKLALQRHAGMVGVAAAIARRRAGQKIAAVELQCRRVGEHAHLHLAVGGPQMGCRALQRAAGAVQQECVIVAFYPLLVAIAQEILQVLSDELVTLSKNDDGLAAVMLHEMGHHAYRHPMRMLVRSSLVALTLMWMTGDVSGIGDTLLQSASFVNEMQFSRGMEREADAFAIAEMQRQGRSLAEMAAIYRALAQAPEREKTDDWALPAWLSTHPAMQERLDAVNEAMAQQLRQ